jgi:serine/threonine protein kinase
MINHDVDVDDDAKDWSSYICSRWYRPPECLCEQPSRRGVAVDIWAVGCILGELFTRSPLFRGQNSKDQLNRILKVVGGTLPCSFESSDDQFSPKDRDRVSRPTQITSLLSTFKAPAEAISLVHVRETPSWPRSWANSSLLQLYPHRNAQANPHILGRPNTFRAADSTGAGSGRATRLHPAAEAPVF